MQVAGQSGAAPATAPQPRAAEPVQQLSAELDALAQEVALAEKPLGPQLTAGLLQSLAQTRFALEGVDAASRAAQQVGLPAAIDLFGPQIDATRGAALTFDAIDFALWRLLDKDAANPITDPGMRRSLEGLAERLGTTSREVEQYVVAGLGKGYGTTLPAKTAARANAEQRAALKAAPRWLTETAIGDAVKGEQIGKAAAGRWVTAAVGDALLWLQLHSTQDVGMVGYEIDGEWYPTYQSSLIAERLLNGRAQASLEASLAISPVVEFVRGIEDARAALGVAHKQLASTDQKRARLAHRHLRIAAAALNEVGWAKANKLAERRPGHPDPVREAIGVAGTSYTRARKQLARLAQADPALQLSALPQAPWLTKVGGKPQRIPRPKA